jgi:acetyl-CoA carboxylase carboxyltransferase component
MRVMGSRQLTADFNFAEPTRASPVIGAEGARAIADEAVPRPDHAGSAGDQEDFIEGYNLNMAIRGSPRLSSSTRRHRTATRLAPPIATCCGQANHRRVGRKHGLIPV